MWKMKRIHLVIVQFLKVIFRSITIIIYLIVLFLSFTVGFFVSQTFYKQADITAWILASISWILSASGMLGLFNAMTSQNWS